MLRTIAIASTIAAASFIAGCNDAPRTAAAPSPAVSAPPVAAVPTPPVPAAGVAPNETAKDSAASTPMGTLTKEEASKSMPMAGQGNNHSSPALDATKK
jgi:hypothetical protein